MIIVATVSADMPSPSCAVIVQPVGAARASAFDIGAAAWLMGVEASRRISIKELRQSRSGARHWRRVVELLRPIGSHLNTRAPFGDAAVRWSSDRRATSPDAASCRRNLHSDELLLQCCRYRRRSQHRNPARSACQEHAQDNGVNGCGDLISSRSACCRSDLEALAANG